MNTGGLLLIKETANATSGIPAGSFLPVYDTNGNICQRADKIDPLTSM